MKLNNFLEDEENRVWMADMANTRKVETRFIRRDVDAFVDAVSEVMMIDLPERMMLAPRELMSVLDWLCGRCGWRMKTEEKHVRKVVAHVRERISKIKIYPHTQPTSTQLHIRRWRLPNHSESLNLWRRSPRLLCCE